MQTISLTQSVAMIPDGASLMIGGFMAVGTPERAINELVRQKKRNLTVIANDTASPGHGIGKLITAEMVRKVIVSHIGLNPETQRQMMAGKLEAELVPQGTLIERIRGARAATGWAAFLPRPALGHRSKKGNSASKLTAGLICSRWRCAPTSPWCRPSLRTISATSATRSRLAISTL